VRSDHARNRGLARKHAKLRIPWKPELGARVSLRKSRGRAPRFAPAPVRSDKRLSCLGLASRTRLCLARRRRSQPNLSARPPSSARHATRPHFCDFCTRQQVSIPSPRRAPRRTPNDVGGIGLFDSAPMPLRRRPACTRRVSRTSEAKAAAWLPCPDPPSGPPLSPCHSKLWAALREAVGSRIHTGGPRRCLGLSSRQSCQARSAQRGS
jgi:hypothetical protein